MAHVLASLILLCFNFCTCAWVYSLFTNNTLAFVFFAKFQFIVLSCVFIVSLSTSFSNVFFSSGTRILFSTSIFFIIHLPRRHYPISVDRYSLFRFDYVPLISLLHRLRGTFTFISSCNMLDVHMRFPAVEPEEEDEEEKEEAHDPGVK